MSEEITARWQTAPGPHGPWTDAGDALEIGVPPELAERWLRAVVPLVTMHAYDCPHYDQTRPAWLLEALPCTCHDAERIQARMSEKPAPR